MRDDISLLKDITVSCANIGVAAIGIKLARFIQELPEDYIVLANELQLPVILLPVELPFETVISRVYIEIVNSQFIRLEYSERIHSSFTQLVLQGGSTYQILFNLSELLERDVCYYDTYFELYYDCRTSQRVPIEQAPMPIEKALERYPHYLLEVSGIQYGFLLVLDERRGESVSKEHMEYGEIAIQHASTVLKLNCQKEISNQQIEAKHRDEFIQGLLLNAFSSEEAIDARKRIYGWDFTKGLVAVVMNCEENTWDLNGCDVDTSLFRRMKHAYPQCMYTKLGAQLVFLIEPPVQPLSRFLPILQQSLSEIMGGIRRDYSLSLYVGIGSYQPVLHQAHLSYREAQTAAQIGRKLGQPVSCYDELGVYRLLSQIHDDQCIAEFLNKHIRKLLDHDASHNSEYLRTLQELIRNDWNLQKTAETLYIHYNTIKNRYYKIGEILEEDLHDPNVKMNLAISVKLLQLGQ